MRVMQATWLGRLGYGEASALQHGIAERRATDAIPDTVLLLEHDPVYTLGRRATDAEVLLDPEALAERGIAVEHTDRGGRVTYHGPGQLVGYPIIDLGASADLVGYVRALERALIATAADHGVAATTLEGLTGVWVGDEKLAAIGVHVSRGITTHGFALNITTDLDAFNGIVPCGIVDKGITSLAALTGSALRVEDVARAAAEHLAVELGRSLSVVGPAAVGREADAHV